MRPDCSDLFTSGVIATTVMLSTFRSEAAVDYLRRVPRWLIDRYDDNLSGLVLASLAEEEAVTAARLFDGSLTSTTVERHDADGWNELGRDQMARQR